MALDCILKLKEKEMKISIQSTMWVKEEEKEEEGKPIDVSFETTVIEDTEIMSETIRANIEGIEFDFDLTDLYQMAMTFKALKGD